MSKVYNELRTKVYSIVYPDYIPLEFGCEVKRSDWYKTFVDRVSSEPADYDWVLRFEIGWWHSMLEREIDENLWPDLSLQQILRALQLFNWNNWPVVEDLYFSSFWLTLYGTENPISIQLDLSKKPKDWDQKTHLQLLELLND